MKKTIAMILVLLFLLPTSIMADKYFGFDLSGMTTDELLELSHQIQLMLFNENLVNGVVIHPGKYIVGEDIPEGIYRIEVILPTNAYAYGHACVYETEDSFIEVGGSMTGEGYENIGEIEMKSGQIFEVSLYSIRLFQYTGLFN